MYLQSEILELSERYVKTLAKETENTLDGPFAGRITGYGKILTFVVLNFFIGNIDIYLHLPSFPNTKMMQVLKILPHRKQRPIYPA